MPPVTAQLTRQKKASQSICFPPSDGGTRSAFQFRTFGVFACAHFTTSPTDCKAAKLLYYANDSFNSPVFSAIHARISA
jgi:hypothetical protein